jgi:hypothetical protein
LEIIILPLTSWRLSICANKSTASEATRLIPSDFYGIRSHDCSQPARCFTWAISVESTNAAMARHQSSEVTQSSDPIPHHLIIWGHMHDLLFSIRNFVDTKFNHTLINLTLSQLNLQYQPIPQSLRQNQCHLHSNFLYNSDSIVVSW